MTSDLELQQLFITLCRDSRLRATRDVDGTAHVVGRRGDIYAYGQGTLAFCLFGPLATSGRKRSFIRKFVPDPLEVVQEGDEEATFTFSPERLAEVAKLARCRFKRVLSPEQAAVLRARLESYRFKPGS